VSKRYPSLDHETTLIEHGHIHIAGLDEAGRGAWAGPVAAAAVILPLNSPGLAEHLSDVCDSKMCTPRQRDRLFDLIRATATAWSISLISAARIDEIGIVPATREAMCTAVSLLAPAPDALLIDALPLPALSIEQQAIAKGDQQCLTIAAASILAKVARDRAMANLDRRYSEYGFARHKGYGTQQHRQALEDLGPTDIHRWYFAPVAQIAQAKSVAPTHMPLASHRKDSL